MRTAFKCLLGITGVLLASLGIAAEPQQTSGTKSQAQGDPAKNLPEGMVQTLSARAFAHTGPINCMVVTIDGKQLITGGREGVVVWNAATGTRLRMLPTVAEIKYMALAPKGDLLAVGYNSAGQPKNASSYSISVFEVASGKELLVVQPKDYLYSLAISHDSMLLAAVGQGGDIQLWKTATGEVLPSLKGHNTSVVDVLFHPDGTSLFAIAIDGTLRQWHLGSGKEIRRLTETAKRYSTRLFLSADGKTLAMNANGHEIASQLRVLDADTLVERFRAEVDPSAWSYDVALSPNCRYLATNFIHRASGKPRICMWDTWTGKQIDLDPGNFQSVRAVCFLPDGKTLASAGEDGVVRLWNVADGKEHELTKGQFDPIWSVAMAPPGNVLAAVSRSGAVELWDTVKYRPLHKLAKPLKELLELAFSPDGQVFVTVSIKGKSAPQCQADLWLVHTGEQLGTLDAVRGRPVFAPDGKTLAIADIYNNVGVWDVVKRTQLHRLAGHTKEVKALAFSGKGRWLASASADKTILLWQVGASDYVAKFTGTNPNIYRLWFSPDDTLLFACHNDGRQGGIDVLDTVTGLHLVTIPATNVPQNGAWLAKDGITMILTAGPGSFRVVDMVTGENIGAELKHGGLFNTADFAADNRQMAMGYQDGRLVLWQPSAWPQRKALPARLEDKQLTEAWQALLSSERIRAYQAIWLLKAAAKQTLPLLRKELRPHNLDQKQVAAWIAQLDSTSYKERERAMWELEQAGHVVEKELRKTLEQKPSLEVRKRIEMLLPKLVDAPVGYELRTIRAIGILHAIGGEEARAILRDLAKGAPGARITLAAQAALERMAAK